MTLKEHTDYCIKLIEKGYGDLPIISSSDDEDNSYQKVENEPNEFLVDNIESYYLDSAFEYNESGDDILPFEPNCIIIN